MLNLICSVLFSIIPVQGQPVDSYDLVEINSRYNDNGVFQEYTIVFRNWNRGTEKFQLHDYRCLFHLPNGFLTKDWQNGGYILCWTDDGDSHYVRVKFLKESWTQYDIMDFEHRAAEARHLHGTPPPCNEDHCNIGGF